MVPLDAASPLTPPPRQGRSRGRVLRAAGVALGLLAAGSLLLWVATPSGDDLGTRVASLAALHGSSVLLPAEVPPLLAKAVVATEDERFYAHHGIDVIGLGRAVLFDVSHLCACQGGSTITQQLVKDVYLGGSDSGLNKLADMALALKVELRTSKPQILADYLSVVLTGYGRYGMAGAACADFHRPLAKLDLGGTRPGHVFQRTCFHNLWRRLLLRNGAGDGAGHERRRVGGRG